MVWDDSRSEKTQRKAQAEAEAAQRAESQKLKKLEDLFWNAPFGQARAAKIAGEKYFQIELALDSSVRSTGILTSIGTTTRQYTGHGRTISDIEAEGWELIHAGFVFKETGQVSRNKFLTTGQQVNTTGLTVGIYLFRATDAPARNDPVWEEWAAQQESG